MIENNQMTSSKKSRNSLEKLDSELSNNSENTSNSLPELTAPNWKPTVSNAKLSAKIDQLAEVTASKDDLTKLANKADLKKLHEENSQSNSELQATIEKKMQDHSSKIVKATLDMKDVAYSQGLTDDITNTRQQVQGIQDRLANSNRNMGDLAKQNDAMAADFKAIGKTLEASTNAVNNNNAHLARLLQQGFQVHTDDVTKSVAEEFERLTGQTYEQLISNTIVNQLQQDINEDKRINVNTKQLAATTINAVNANNQLIQDFGDSVNCYLIEFAAILLLTLAVPGWWKLLAVVGTTLLAYVFNTRKVEDNDDDQY